MKLWISKSWALPALALLSLLGCERRPNAVSMTSESSRPRALDSQQKPPFDSDKANTGISPSGVLVPASVPAGTAITVRLESPVSSATSHRGDPFDAVLEEPILFQGRTVIPRGASVRGRVAEAKPSGRLHESGYLRVVLAAISVNNKAVPIESSSISIKGASHEKRNWEMIGGGAGAGTLVGGLAAGGKGALIGSASGAAAGTGLAYGSGKKDVGFAVERRLTFRLTSAMTLPDN